MSAMMAVVTYAQLPHNSSKQRNKYFSEIVDRRYGAHLGFTRLKSTSHVRHAVSSIRLVIGITYMHASKLTVAHFVSNFLPVTERWIYDQIQLQIAWRSIVLTHQHQNQAIFPLEKIYVFQHLTQVRQIYQRIMWRLVGYAPYFLQSLMREEARVLHAHFGPSGFFCLPLARRAGIPLVTTFYGFDLSQLPQTNPEWRARYLKLFEQGDLFLVEGPQMRQQLIVLGCPAAKVQVQRLGVGLSELPYQPRQLDAEKTVRVLAAGTFTEKKGLPDALQAFARVFAQNRALRLTVIGDARPNRPKEQVIKRLLYKIVEDNNLSDVVTFLGYQPHPVLVEAFYRHHILISPSVQAQDGDNEGGSPVTITEAIATGMPVLSTTHCDIPEVVLDGQNGFLVNEHDVDALTERLLYLATHPKDWSVLGQAGRRHIEANFDLHRQAQVLGDRYASLV